MRDTVFLTYICVGIILLTSKKFTDVYVAGKRYRLVTLIRCQELVSFTSSCVIKYVVKTSFTSLMLVSDGSCNTLFMIANIQVCRIQLKLPWHNRYVFRNFLVYLVCCCNLLLFILPTSSSGSNWKSNCIEGTFSKIYFYNRLLL